MIGMTANFIGYNIYMVISISNPTRLVERSNVRNTIACLFSFESFLLPSGFCLLLELEVVLIEAQSLSVIMSFSIRSKLFRALMTLYFAVE